jgi:hypothetical protein
VAVAPDASLLDPLFHDDVAAQLARADLGERQGLVFVTGTLRADGRGFALQRPDAWIPLSVPLDEATFPYRENLERLAQVGANVALVARVLEGELEPRPVAVALATSDGSRGPWFSLGYDRLTRAHLLPTREREGQAKPPEGARESVTTRLEALVPLQRRVLRYALAGHTSLPGAALPEVGREASRLREALFPIAADGLVALSTAHEAARVAELWLALHVYLTTATRSLVRSAWGVKTP